ncbi:MORN repeat protein [Pelomyxa schiedti]|nr:MORN repeat protein [Pelomyxa schiedti]
MDGTGNTVSNSGGTSAAATVTEVATTGRKPMPGGVNCGPFFLQLAARVEEVTNRGGATPLQLAEFIQLVVPGRFSRHGGMLFHMFHKLLEILCTSSTNSGTGTDSTSTTSSSVNAAVIAFLPSNITAEITGPEHVRFLFDIAAVPCTNPRFALHVFADRKGLQVALGPADPGKFCLDLGDVVRSVGSLVGGLGQVVTGADATNPADILPQEIKDLLSNITVTDFYIGTTEKMVPVFKLTLEYKRPHEIWSLKLESITLKLCIRYYNDTICSGGKLKLQMEVNPNEKLFLSAAIPSLSGPWVFRVRSHWEYPVNFGSLVAGLITDKDLPGWITKRLPEISDIKGKLVVGGGTPFSFYFSITNMRTPWQPIKPDEIGGSSVLLRNFGLTVGRRNSRFHLAFAAFLDIGDISIPLIFSSSASGQLQLCLVSGDEPFKINDLGDLTLPGGQKVGSLAGIEDILDWFQELDISIDTFQLNVIPFTVKSFEFQVSSHGTKTIWDYLTISNMLWQLQVDSPFDGTARKVRWNASISLSIPGVKSLVLAGSCTDKGCTVRGSIEELSIVDLLEGFGLPSLDNLGFDVRAITTFRKISAQFSFGGPTTQRVFSLKGELGGIVFQFKRAYSTAGTHTSISFNRIERLLLLVNLSLEDLEVNLKYTSGKHSAWSLQGCLHMVSPHSVILTNLAEYMHFTEDPKVVIEYTNGSVSIRPKVVPPSIKLLKGSVVIRDIDLQLNPTTPSVSLSCKLDLKTLQDLIKCDLSFHGSAKVSLRQPIFRGEFGLQSDCGVRLLKGLWFKELFLSIEDETVGFKGAMTVGKPPEEASELDKIEVSALIGPELIDTVFKGMFPPGVPLTIPDCLDKFTEGEFQIHDPLKGIMSPCILSGYCEQDIREFFLSASKLGVAVLPSSTDCPLPPIIVQLWNQVRQPKQGSAECRPLDRPLLVEFKPKELKFGLCCKLEIPLFHFKAIVDVTFGLEYGLSAKGFMWPLRVPHSNIGPIPAGSLLEITDYHQIMGPYISLQLPGLLTFFKPAALETTGLAFSGRVRLFNCLESSIFGRLDRDGLIFDFRLQLDNWAHTYHILDTRIYIRVGSNGFTFKTHIAINVDTDKMDLGPLNHLKYLIPSFFASASVECSSSFTEGNSVLRVNVQLNFLSFHVEFNLDCEALSFRDIPKAILLELPKQLYRQAKNILAGLATQLGDAVVSFIDRVKSLVEEGPNLLQRGIAKILGLDNNSKRLREIDLQIIQQIQCIREAVKTQQRDLAESRLEFANTRYMAEQNQQDIAELKREMEGKVDSLNQRINETNSKLQAEITKNTKALQDLQCEMLELHKQTMGEMKKKFSQLVHRIEVVDFNSLCMNLEYQLTGIRGPCLQLLNNIDDPDYFSRQRPFLENMTTQIMQLSASLLGACLGGKQKSLFERYYDLMLMQKSTAAIESITERYQDIIQYLVQHMKMAQLMEFLSRFPRVEDALHQLPSGHKLNSHLVLVVAEAHGFKYIKHGVNRGILKLESAPMGVTGVVSGRLDFMGTPEDRKERDTFVGGMKTTENNIEEETHALCLRHSSGSCLVGGSTPPDPGALSANLKVQLEELTYQWDMQLKPLSAEMENVMLHGKGTLTFSNKNEFRGVWDSNQVQGEGAYFFAGSCDPVWQGYWSQKSANNAKGEVEMEIKFKLHPFFGNGVFRGTCSNMLLPNGKGTIEFGGNSYMGMLESGHLHGEGQMHWANGTTYTGSWENNQRRGKGKACFPDGRCYDGDWLEDKPHGYGALYWPSGDFFQGEFQNGCRSGQGTLCFHGDGHYQGDWVADQMHGHGERVWGNGIAYVGNWDHGLASCITDEKLQSLLSCYEDMKTTVLEGKLSESNKNLANALDSKQFDLVEGFLEAGPTQKKNIGQVQAWVSRKMEELKQAVQWWLPLEQNAAANAASIADLFKSLQMVCNFLQGTPESPRAAPVIIAKFKSDLGNLQRIVNDVIGATINQVQGLSKQGRVAKAIEHVKVLKQVQLSLTVANVLQEPGIAALRTLLDDFLDETKLLDEKINEATQNGIDCAKINLLFGTAGGEQVKQRVADVVKMKCSAIEERPGAEFELEDLAGSLLTLKPELLSSINAVIGKAKDRMRKNNENRERVVLSLFNDRYAEGVQRELLKLKKEWDKSVYDKLILDLTGSFNQLCVDRASVSPSSFEFLWKASSLIQDLPSSEFTKLCQEFLSISLDMIKKIQKETEPIVTAEFNKVACLPGPKQSQLTGLGLVLFILPYCTRQDGIFSGDPLREKASSMVRECTALMEAIKNQAEKLHNAFHSSLSCGNFLEVTTVLPDIKRLELGHKCLQPLESCNKAKEQLAKMSAECDYKLDVHTPASFAEVEVIWKSEAAVHHLFKEVPETTVEFEIKQKVTKFFNERHATALNLWDAEPRNYAAINELLVLFINGRSLCGTLNIGPPQQFMEKVLEGVRTAALPPVPDPSEVANMLRDVSTHSCFTIMCVDESGSMDRDPWISLKTAVEAFCTRRISQCAQACLPCEDRVWVIGYTDSAFHRIPSSLEAEPERLVSGLSSRLTHFDGGMASFQAPLTAVKQVLDGPGNWRPVADMMKVLLFTTYSKCDDGDAEMQKLYNAHPDLKVFVVGFGEGCDAERLKSLAAQGHGSYFAGLDSAALMRVFDTLATAISAPGCMFKIEGSDCYVGQSCPIPFHPFRLDVQPNVSGGMTSPPEKMTHGETCFDGASLLPIDSTAAKTRDMVMKIIFNWENAPQQALLQSKYMTECIILSLVPDHPNVIHPLGALVIPCLPAEFVEKIPSDKMYFREKLANNKSLAIVMPHCGITLSSFFSSSSSSNNLTVEGAWNLFFQGLRAICHIESHFVVHRDIKGDNILIDPETGKLTLIDFGESQHCPNMEVHLSAMSLPWGNTGTMPPELSVFLKRITRGTSGVFSYSKCDSFALALTFWNALLPQAHRFIGSSMNHDMSTFNTQSLLSHFPVPLFSLARSHPQQQARESPQQQTRQHQHDSVLESVMIGMMNPDKAARLGAADAIHELTS